MTVTEIPTTAIPTRRGTGVTLPDGTTLGVHPLHAASTDLFARFVESLSPEARYRRFFQPVPRPTERFVRPLCDVDQVRHIAWLLLAGDTPVAEVRLVASDHEPGVAELAVAVDQDWRRRGVARRALSAIGVAGAAGGVHTFTATIQADNRASAEMVRSLGLALRFDDGVLSGRGPVPAWTGTPAEADAIRSLQAAAANRANLAEVA